MTATAVRLCSVLGAQLLLWFAALIAAFIVFYSAWDADAARSNRDLFEKTFWLTYILPPVIATVGVTLLGIRREYRPHEMAVVLFGGVIMWQASHLALQCLSIQNACEFGLLYPFETAACR
jgi:hypothetical protein